MNIANYERMVLGAQFLDDGAARKVISEISDTSFAYGPGTKPSLAHAEIQKAIIDLVMEGKSIDVGTVATQLGDQLSKVGGQQYLIELSRTLPSMGITSTRGLPEWASVVDKAARIRQIKIVLEEGQIGNVEEAMESISDVDQYLSDILSQLNTANDVKTDYEPISQAAEKAKQRLIQEARGEAVSWLPIGWPSLDKFNLLPYRSLFVLLGISSMGKSQLLAQMILGAAIQMKRYELPGLCLLNTYEMGSDRYVLRMASCLTGVDLRSENVENEQSDEFSLLMEAIDFISTLPIRTNDGDMTSYQVNTQSQILGAQFGGLRVVGIDYAELVSDINSDSEEQRVSGIFRNAQRLSRTGPCVILLSQFNDGVNRDNTKLGSIDMIRYSRAGRHAAEMIGIVYNPPQMRKAGIPFKLHSMFPSADNAYLFIGKNKEGPLGYVPLGWEAECTRFSDPATFDYGVGELYKGISEVGGNFVSTSRPLEFGDF